jgi:outer membrane biosynthesis protein TonB
VLCDRCKVAPVTVLIFYFFGFYEVVMPQMTDKVLRIGVVQSGRILDEQVFRKAETVFVGDSEKAHFVVPSSFLSGKFPMFTCRSGRYELLLTAKMTGKIFLNGEAREIEDLIKNGNLKRRGDEYVLPLSPDYSGKVFIGNVIVLFQFIVPSPKPPKLRLPKSIKGSWTQHLDWPFVSIELVIMVLGYFFFAIYLMSVPKPEPVELSDVPNRFAKLIAPELDTKDEVVEEKEVETPKEEKEVDPNAQATSTATKKVVEKQETAPQKAEKPRDASTIQREESVRVAEMQKKVAGKGLLRMIGSVGEGGTGGFITDVLGDGGKDRDIDSALSGVKQIGVATSSSQRSRKGDAGAVETAKIDDLKVESSGGAVAVKGRAEKAVVGKATVGKTEVDGAVDSASVAKTIRGSSAAVKRCYDKALLVNPTLKGKISVTILINEKGRVESVEISEDTVKDAEVTKCIKSVVSRLRFPKPDGGPASVTFPFVFTN